MKQANIVDGEKYFVKKSAEKWSVPAEYCGRAAKISKDFFSVGSHKATYDDDWWCVGSHDLRKLREGEK